jgi:hypothetical protein
MEPKIDKGAKYRRQVVPSLPTSNNEIFIPRTLIGGGTHRFKLPDYDIYDFLYAFGNGVVHPEIDHAVKKLLMPGQRGGKSEIKDLEEAIVSIQRRIDRLKAVVVTGTMEGTGSNVQNIPKELEEENKE